MAELSVSYIFKNYSYINSGSKQEIVPKTENKDIVPKLKIVTDLKEMSSTKLKNNIFTRNDTIVALISIHCNFQMVWWFMVFYPTFNNISVIS